MGNRFTFTVKQIVDTMINEYGIEPSSSYMDNPDGWTNAFASSMGDFEGQCFEEFHRRFPECDYSKHYDTYRYPQSCNEED